MNKNIIIILGVVILLGAAFYMFSGSNNAPVSPTPPPPVTDVTPPPAPSPETSTSTSVGSEKSFTVTGQNFSFSPSSITVKKGDTVKITFKNASGFHDFRIDEFSVATKKIQGGAEETVTFKADKTGSFEYYCSVGEHRAMGMHGTLIVQ